MFLRLFSATFLGLFFVSTVAAQTVRFDTNVGTFDMELNPTGNINLQPHVDNMLAYVEAGLYDLTVINRAAEGFVMQMGGFQALSSTLPANFGDFPANSAFAPVIVDADGDGAVDFDVSSLTNTRGTVSLALSNSANTGTNSFFVNLGTNPSLDAASMRFVPFALVKDMATIDLILSLNQFNFSDGSLAGDDVPILEDNRLVIVERAFVLETMVGPALALAATGSEFPLPGSSELQSLAVPEPSTFALAAGALMLVSLLSRRKV